MPKKSGKSKEFIRKLNLSEPRVSKKAGAVGESNEASLKNTGKSSTTTTNTNKSAVEPADQLMQQELARTLTHHVWYHGMMPRDVIEDLLKNDGDFLGKTKFSFDKIMKKEVRKTEVQNKARYAVSVSNNKRIRHILLHYTAGENLWAIRDVKAHTIIELIEELVHKKLPVQTDGTLLVNAVPRPEYYLLHEHIELKTKLGAGAFGEVFIGVLKKNSSESEEVAVKKLKGVMMKKERCEFIKEAQMMRNFDHPNLVQLIGVAPNEFPIMIVLELCPGGSLQSHVKKVPDISKEKLTQYCTDACRGMAYLSHRKVIHRDIAARNCLLGKNDEAKISDFGLSVANTTLLKLDKLKQMPVRWLAPEVIRKGEFSSKSDVWAYGVMVWEVFSHCKTDPFPGESNQQAKAKILSGRDPMEPPEGMPPLMQDVMKKAFTQDPTKRPDFEDLLRLISPKDTVQSKDSEK